MHIIFDVQMRVHIETLLGKPEIDLSRYRLLPFTGLDGQQMPLAGLETMTASQTRLESPQFERKQSCCHIPVHQLTRQPSLFTPTLRVNVAKSQVQRCCGMFPLRELNYLLCYGLSCTAETFRLLINKEFSIIYTQCPFCLLHLQMCFAVIHLFLIHFISLLFW